MNKVLSKRLLRDVKSNLLRYIALTLLIVMGMYIISALIGSAETIITGCKANNIKNHAEDGQFSVFIPLTVEQEKALTDKGVSIEKMFSIDVETDSGNILRIMKTRKDINLIELDEGRTAENDSEAVIEKLYCAANGLAVGDSIDICGRTLTIVGKGSTADYDLPLRKMSDVAASSKSFGLLFVTEECYNGIKSSSSQKAEELCYAYRLNSVMTDEELKQTVKDFDFDYKDVEDAYFKELMDDTVGKKDEIRESIDKLSDGSAKLSDGLNELSKNSGTLTDGTDSVFEYFLSSATASLNTSGINETLTEDNYEEVLDRYISLTHNEQLMTLKSSLQDVEKLTHGTKDYTDGVEKAYDGSVKLDDGITKLSGKTDEIIDEYFDFEMDNLTSFIKADDNQRILAAANDQLMNKQIGLIAGIIIMVLFTYVISVFVIHQIQSESSVIGSLYALGIKKRTLLRHYITIPTVISFIGGIIGTAIGLSGLGTGFLTVSNSVYFSVAELKPVYPLYLLIYCVVMPPVISVIVNSAVINSKLSKTALSLMRNERDESKVSRVNLKSADFMTGFTIRQLLREARTSLTVIFSMIISLLIFMIGADCYVLCQSIQRGNAESIKYEYMYMLKYPQKTVPDKAEACYSESLSKDSFDFTLDITVMGIESDNKYFDADVVKGKSKITVSQSMAEKYGLHKGSKLILTDSANEMDYAFTVEDVCSYASGLTVFMDIDSMRELFDKEDDYYNVLLSDTELDIDEGRLYSVMTRSDTEKSAEIFIELMMPMVIMTTLASLIIFCTVMYLMMNVMIDHASFGISLIKIFGFRTGEIRKLYLNGNLLTVAVGAAIGIPVSKLLIDLIYPWLIANTSCGINLSFPWYLYAGIFAAIMVFYFIINASLVSKLKKITPALVLKNRE